MLAHASSTPVLSGSSALHCTMITGGFFFPGGGFEWDDDFSPDPFMSKTTSSLLGSKPSLQPSKYFSPPPPARSTEQSWPHVSPCSRFSISPANIASFSLTHLTDSDIEQGGEKHPAWAGMGMWSKRSGFGLVVSTLHPPLCGVEDLVM